MLPQDTTARRGVARLIEVLPQEQVPIGVLLPEQVHTEAREAEAGTATVEAVEAQRQEQVLIDHRALQEAVVVAIEVQDEVAVVLEVPEATGVREAQEDHRPDRGQVPHQVEEETKSEITINIL